MTGCVDRLPLDVLPARGPVVGTVEWLQRWVDVDAGRLQG